MAAVGTGVTIGSRTVRVLQARRDKAGNWAITRALAVPFRGSEVPDSQRISEARAALKTAQVTKGKAFLGLTGRDLIVRYTQVPPVPDWRLEMLMNFEIQEVAEQSGGDVSAAYSQLEIDDTTSGDNVVMVALAKNGYLVPRLGAIKTTGLDVVGGTPRALGAFWAYKENGHLRFDETVLVMHIGHENTDVAISRNGKLLFARNVSGGSKMFTEALMNNMRVNFPTAEKMKSTKGNLTPRGKAKYRDSGEEKIANNLMGVGGHFVSAYNSSVMFAKAQTKVPECRPDRMVLMGAGALLRGLPEYLESNLSLPVELFDPFDDLDLSELSKEQADALRQEQGGMAVVLGLAQMAADPEAVRVEILPEADRKKRQFMEGTLFTIISAAVVTAALVLAFVMSGAADTAGNSEIAILAEGKSKYDKWTQEFDKARETVSLLNDEKYRLRHLGSLGPAFQLMVTSIQRVMNDDRQPFEEIFFRKITAGMKPHQQIDPQSQEKRVVLLPTGEFTADIRQVGARKVANAYSEFGAALSREINAQKGAGNTSYLEYQEMGGLDTKNNTFKFRIIQKRFPEKEEAAAEGDEGK